MTAGRAATAAEPRVLRFVPQGNLANPDPIWTTTTIARNHGYLIWDTLYGADATLTPQPQMVASDEVSPDGLTWRFELREGLRFHDGTPVRAADCVASIGRWSARRSIGQKLKSLTATMRALDERRLEIALKAPFPLMRRALGMDTCFMMPERIARTDPFTQIGEYVGSGPYSFAASEWVAGARAVYRRFDGYAPRAEPASFTAGGKVAHFDRVEWIVMPDPATAAAALRQGEVDWLEQPLPDLLDTLRAAPGVTVRNEDPLGSIAMIAFNHVQPPFDNPRLLRALLPAIDQTAFLQAALGDATALYRPGAGVFVPGTPMATDAGLAALTGPRDVARARAMVAESGYRGEPAVLLSPSDYPVQQALAQVLRDTLLGVGVAVDYVSVDWGTLVQRRASKAPPSSGGWSAFCTLYEGLSLLDPAAYFPLRGNGADAWFGWPTSPRMEALRDAWFAAASNDEQRRICADMQRLVWEEVPFIPLGQIFQPSASRTSLTGIIPAPFPLFWNVRRA